MKSGIKKTASSYPRLTLDFHTNKRIIDEVVCLMNFTLLTAKVLSLLQAVVPSKRLRNKIAGFTTHLMRRIEKGPVRGISFKLQEEERERKDNYVPEVSALNVSSTGLEVDEDTKVCQTFCSQDSRFTLFPQALLDSLRFDSIPVTVINTVLNVAPERAPRRDRKAVPGAGR